MAKRNPISARGVELLALIAGASEGILFLTQEEGAEALAAGHIELTGAINEKEGTAGVKLTAAGAAANAGVPDSAAAQGSFKATIRSDVAIPEKTARAGRKTGSGKYPFALLEVGQSFHIPQTAENEDPAGRIAPSLSRVRKQFAVPVLNADGSAVMETVTQKLYQVDSEGKRVKNAEGGYVQTGETQVTRQKMQDTRQFEVLAVDANDPDGPGARIWRTA